MATVNMHEAKTHLSRLVDDVVAGETVIIAKAGKPVAKLIRVDLAWPPERIGFLVGEGDVPEDFDTMGDDQIANLFEGADH